MKKLLVISSLIVSFTTASANAKTQGSYFGIDILEANTKVKSKVFNTDKSSGPVGSEVFNSAAKDSSVGFGINYKYAINMNNFFIAPGLFYESMGAEVKTETKNQTYGITDTQKTKISSRSGVKLDLGYDVMDKLAVYIPVGFAVTSYKETHEAIDNTTRATFAMARKNRNAVNAFYGAGFAFYPMKKLAISLEYTRSRINIKQANLPDEFGGSSTNKINLDVIKLGASYKF